MSFLSASIGHPVARRLRGCSPLGLSPKNWPAICFIEIRPIPLLPAGVERLVQRRVLVEPGAVLEHDRVDDPAFGRRLDDAPRSLWWVEKPMNLALPDLRIASAVSLNSWLLTRLIGVVEAVVVAQAVDEEEVDVVGPQGRQPLVDHRRSSARARAACPW